MKANEAPENIYIHVRANKELGTTWHGKKITNSDIEYVRKDAFIYKIQTELDKLYHKWFDDSTGLEVSEEGAELGALDMAYEAFQEIIDNLKE
jgi:uncharacterized protein YeeX (DUF496 family)